MDPYPVQTENPAAPPTEEATPTAIDAGSPTAPPESAENSPADAETGADQDEAPKPRPIQKRISELVREREEARREREAAQREAEYWRQQAGTRPAEEPKKAADLKPEDFSTYEDYLVARAEGAAAERMQAELAKRATESSRAAEERQRDAVMSEFKVRAENVRTKHEDFDLVVSDLAHAIGNNHAMADAIVASEAGPDVAYYLGHNRQEAARIAQLPPLSQVIEIGRLAERLASAPRRASSAPPPPRTVAGGGAPARDPASASSFQEYVALRRKQQGYR